MKIGDKTIHIGGCLPSWFDSVCACCRKSRLRHRHSGTRKRKLRWNKYVSRPRRQSRNDRHNWRHFKRNISSQPTGIICSRYASAISWDFCGDRAYVSGVCRISRGKSSCDIRRRHAVLLSVFIFYVDRCFLSRALSFKICFPFVHVGRSIRDRVHRFLYGRHSADDRCVCLNGVYFLSPPRKH